MKRKFKQLPKVSIVIPTYNNINDLLLCIKSIYNNTKYPNYEIIIVNNGTLDIDRSSLSINYMEIPIKIINTGRNLGSSGGYQIGLMNASGKYVALMNDDMIVEPGWLEPLVHLMEKYGNLGVIDAKYLDLTKRKFSIGWAARFMDKYGNIVAQGIQEEDRGQYDKPSSCHFGLTIFRRKALLQAGTFDVDFFCGFEEVDVCWRIRIIGYKCIYWPTSVILHKGGASLKALKGSLPSNIHFHMLKNRLLMLLKNYSLGYLIRVLPIVLMEYIAYMVYYLYKKSPFHAKNCITSIIWNIKNLSSTITKRRFVQRKRRVQDKYFWNTFLNYNGFLRYILK